MARFPRSEKYNREWLLASVSGAANPLWLAEWLSEAMELKAGMRVLDLACGRATSSIFLHREFGVQVWATDLWISETENRMRIDDAGCAESVFPVHADARSLPFAAEFFDAIVCIDGYPYFGTDDLYLGYLARFLKKGGQMGIAGAGLTKEIEGDIPPKLKGWWDPTLWALHSAPWWKRHWEKTGFVTVETADAMEEGWKRWLDWYYVVAPTNQVEIDAITADAGEYIGYVRVVGRRTEFEIDEPIVSLPAEYRTVPLLAPNR